MPEPDRFSTRAGSLVLLVWVVVFIAAAGLVLNRFSPVTTGGVPDWLLLAVMLGAGGVGLALIPGVDRVLFAIAAMLTAVGTMTIIRLNPALANDPNTPADLARRHLLSIGAGLIVMLAITVAPRRPAWLRRYKYTWLALSVLLLAATLLLGEETRGARLWLRFGPVQFQPSELLRLTMIAYLAGYLDEHRDLISGWFAVGRLRLPPAPYLLPVGIVGAVAALMLVLQNDLGSALLLFGIVLTMMYLATGLGRFVWWGLIGFVVLGGLAATATPRIGGRVQNWLDPWQDPLGVGYQQIAAEFAFAAGGLLGQGPGAGMPSSIPDVHTDFIFAAIAEEMGLLGALATIVLLLLLIWRGFRIGLNATNGFERLFALGLASALALQSFLILGGVTRVIPLTGLTVPFVSYGGSAMVTNFAVIGLLLAVSRATSASGTTGENERMPPIRHRGVGPGGRSPVHS